MTTTTNTQKTPELLNKAHLVGTIYHHDLKVEENKEVTVKNNGAEEKRKMDIISGTIDVRTGENETHKVRIYARSQKNDGGENNQYKGYLTLKNEMITVKELAENKSKDLKKLTDAQLSAYVNKYGSELTFDHLEPTRIKVDGSLNVSEYINDRGMQSFLQVQGQWLNRIEAGEDFEPIAKYDIEGIVATKRPEKAGEDDTGRTIVKLLIPAYGGKAFELEFIAPQEYEDYIEQNFELDGTVNLYGKIINFSKKTVTKVSGGFGEDKEDVKWENVRELQIGGGKVYEYDEYSEVNKAFSPEQAKELHVARNTTLAQIKAQAEEKKKQGAKSSFGGATTPQNGGKPIEGVGKFF